jgi:hypothetical protein
MTVVTVEGDDLVIRLSPLEKLAALHGNVRVPLSAVRAVAVEPDPRRARRGFRLPGTGIPGVLSYGTWRSRGNRRDFVAVVDRRPALRVDLGDDAPFQRLLVSVTDPEATAAQVARAAQLPPVA